MNERINKLFGQAMDQSIPETWTTLTHSQLSILKDKFAELIVKECVDCARGAGLADDVAVRNTLGFNDGIAEAVTNIKKHFGVEL